MLNNHTVDFFKLQMSYNVLSKFVIFCLATFRPILGMWPIGHWLEMAESGLCGKSH